MEAKKILKELRRTKKYGQIRVDYRLDTLLDALKKHERLGSKGRVILFLARYYLENEGKESVLRKAGF